MQRYYEMGLQEFTFERSYDAVWIQWVLCYLTDEDLVVFLRRCREACPTIYVKENVSADEPTEDEADCSVARTREAFERIFSEAGLTVVAHELQEGFPEELLRVSMWVLR